VSSSARSSPAVAIACPHGRPPKLYGETAIVVIDVIRAATTVITAAAAGHRIFPVCSPSAALRTAAGLAAPILAGEIDGIQPLGFDLHNSPSQTLMLASSSRPIVLLSSSGTRLMLEAVHHRPTYVCCLRNVTAQADHLAGLYCNVLIVGVDRHGEFREEDRLCAGRIAMRLLEHGYQVLDSPTQDMIAQFGAAPDHLIVRSRSACYLRETGQDEDLVFVLDHIDDLDFVLRVCKRAIPPMFSIC
jgi:2-phosphosulfolactate phosphatase